MKPFRNQSVLLFFPWGSRDQESLFWTLALGIVLLFFLMFWSHFLSLPIFAFLEYLKFEDNEKKNWGASRGEKFTDLTKLTYFVRWDSKSTPITPQTTSFFFFFYGPGV
jgi:hypothetical protein